jgi:hypothetical protein
MSRFSFFSAEIFRRVGVAAPVFDPEASARLTSGSTGCGGNLTLNAPLFGSRSARHFPAHSFGRERIDHLQTNDVFEVVDISRYQREAIAKAVPAMMASANPIFFCCNNVMACWITLSFKSS